MNIKLLHATPSTIAVKAIRKCYQSGDSSDSLGAVIGLKDASLVGKIIDSDHTSTLEHVSYNYEIDDISRAVLQELARHRIASLSVESTRYCLKKILANKDANLDDFIVLTGNHIVDNVSRANLKNVVNMLRENPEIRNDIGKFPLPEAFKTNLIWTINIRSLRNFLRLRTNKRALWEIRELANKVYKVLPEEHRIFFTDIMEA